MSDKDLIGALPTPRRMPPGRRVAYVPSRVGFGAFMLSDQMRDVTAEVAGDIAAMAQMAPGVNAEDEPSRLEKRIRKGYRVKKEAGAMTVGGNLRVRVDVVNDVEGSALFEFGARNIRRRRTLGQSGAAFGDFKPESGPS